ncbi:MAG: zf-TFIIB domain-containing protein [Myxococcales bacterium]|nr:zf-TFIIB domain-containing protein [Myxococcales bacterium]
MSSDGDDVVCLGCGRSVGAEGGLGCDCPPPTIAPRSLSQPLSGHYRSVPPTATCPRCKGRLVEQELHDALLLDCVQCGGLFVPKPTIDALGEPQNHNLRIAFPRRVRRPEPLEVAYLNCPLCSGRMNRVNFAKVSGVIVDVCTNDGVWFDQGEVDAVIDFVEQGGLERARRRESAELEREKERLRAERAAFREQGERASMWRRDHVEITAGERLLLTKVASWFRF